MPFSNDTIVFSAGGFDFRHGPDFEHERSRSANEIMRRNQAGETNSLADGRYYFAAEVEYDVGEALMNHERIVQQLAGAPIASWVLARLMALSDDAYPKEIELRYDGGGYAHDYYVTQGTTPIAWLQLQGDMSGVVLVGSAGSQILGDAINDALMAALLLNPEDIRDCNYSVYDPEWEYDAEYFEPEPTEDTRNEYGWDGRRFLGSENVREKSN